MSMFDSILIDINSRGRRWRLGAVAVRISMVAVLLAGCARTSQDPALVEVDRARAGAVELVLLAPAAPLKQTRNYCTIEFRQGGRLVDVGSVHVRTSMTMEGAPMDGFVTEPKRVGAGRYAVEMVLAMTGNWQITINWDGPEGKGSVTFPASVSS